MEVCNVKINIQHKCEEPSTSNTNNKNNYHHQQRSKNNNNNNIIKCYKLNKIIDHTWVSLYQNNNNKNDFNFN